MKTESELPEGVFHSFEFQGLSLSDIGAYTTLMRQVIAGADFLDDDKKRDLLESKTEEYYRARLEKPEKWSLLVSKDAEKVVGVLEASIEDNSQDRFGFVRWICIDPSYRGRGIGPSLYDSYGEVLQQRGVPLMIAGIADINVASLRMHEKAGFDMQHPYDVKPGSKYYSRAI